jgi:hypothetical protein
VHLLCQSLGSVLQVLRRQKGPAFAPDLDSYDAWLLDTVSDKAGGRLSLGGVHVPERIGCRKRILRDQAVLERLKSKHRYRAAVPPISLKMCHQPYSFPRCFHLLLVESNTSLRVGLPSFPVVVHSKLPFDPLRKQRRIADRSFLPKLQLSA